MSAAPGHIMAGALTGSSPDRSAQKIAEAVIQNWRKGTAGCCAWRVLSKQDSREQKGQLQEVEAANHLIIFYPKFHCELDFIERFWYAAKWYAKENCEYSFEGLRKIAPAALDSASAVSINRYNSHCARVINAHTEIGRASCRERV